MFCPNKNSYLQLVCSINPRVIDKAVDLAMRRPPRDLPNELPPAMRLDSMQPSIYCAHVDITRSTLGFGRVGLRLLNRDLHSPDHLVQLQALHTLLDQIQISEHAMFLINLHVVYRLVDFMKDDNRIIREKVCLIYTQLASYYQGREHISRRPVIIDNLMWIIQNDIKEIRYVAAFTMWTLSRHHSTCRMIVNKNFTVPILLKMIKSDHVEIAILHLKTVARITEQDAEPALRSNGFQIMRKLFHAQNPRLVAAAMNVMKHMCKHDVGRKLADIHYMTWKIRKYLCNPDTDVVTAAVGILQFTTVTTAAKFRAREFFTEIIRNLVHLSQMPSKPHLQLQCMQVLINFCDSPDIRVYIKKSWEKKVKEIKIKNAEQWDGTTGSPEGPGLDTGHYYRTVYVEHRESIKSDFDDNCDVVNAYNYIRKLHEVKDNLIRAINVTPYS